MTRSCWIVLCGCFAFASQCRLAAQSCFSFNDDYAAYESVSYDGTNIYTSVTVDGQGQMTLNSGNGCGSINWGSAQHTPMALNIISNSSTGAHVGGMQPGANECPDCYLSVTNSQSMAATPGTTYNFSSSGGVNCNFGGAIFGINWPSAAIELNQTYGTKIGTSEDPEDGDPIGIYIPACASGAKVCPVGNSWDVEFGKGEAVPTFVKTLWLSLSVSGTVVECFADPFSSTQSGAGPCW